MASQNTPSWLNRELFSCLLKEYIQEFKNINEFSTEAAISCGENYLTTVLRIQIQAQLQDNTIRQLKYIIKLPLVNDRGDDHDFHDFFVTELDMYESLVPELEAMYAKHTELAVSFKPLHLKFPEMPLKCDYILLEDLRPKGYKNLQRTLGLAMPEIEAVLKKLAQWHAASAMRVVELGDYEDTYRKSYFTEEYIKMVENMNNIFTMPFLECMQQYNMHPGHMQIITNYTAKMTDLYMEFGRIDDQEFNVLNHGDFWCNNFMFKYNNSGAIEDICFLDFQLPKYGTPALDLFCLLMTSTNMDIKLKKFDDLITHYHEQLVAHLKLLKYPRQIPTLSQLQMSLQKNGLWAFVCAQRMLPVALYPTSSESNVDNFMGDSDVSMEFKRKMMLNPSYVQQIKIILPWLIERNYIN